MASPTGEVVRILFAPSLQIVYDQHPSNHAIKQAFFLRPVCDVTQATQFSGSWMGTKLSKRTEDRECLNNLRPANRTKSWSEVVTMVDPSDVIYSVRS